MKKRLLSLFITLLTVNCSQPQEESKDKWQLNFDMTLKEIDRKYYFVIDGKTNLPDSTQLTAVLSYIYFLKIGASEDFTPCEGYLADKTLEVENGKFYATLGGYKRKPFSVNYRCIVKIDPQNQFENVKDVIKGTDYFEKTVDIRVGTALEFEKEIARVKSEIKDDFSKIDMIFEQLKSTFDKFYKAERFDKEAWQKWSKNLNERIDGIWQTNEERIGNWLMSLETQGKIYIGGLCDRLKELIEVCAKTLQSKGDTKNVYELANAFTEIYNEEMYAIGFDTPIDADKAADCIKKLEGIVKNGDGDYFQSAFSEIILELSNILPERHLKLLTEISEKFQSSDLQGIKVALAKLENELNLNNKR